MSRGIVNPITYSIVLSDGTKQDVEINYTNEVYPLPVSWSVCFQVNAISYFAYREDCFPMKPEQFSEYIKTKLEALKEKRLEIFEVLNNL